MEKIELRLFKRFDNLNSLVLGSSIENEYVSRSLFSNKVKSNLFNAPETYMDKIAISENKKDIVDLDYSIKKNIMNLADYKNTTPENLTACILDGLQLFLL